MRRELELQAEPDARPIARPGRSGNKPHAALIGHKPGRGRILRPGRGRGGEHKNAQKQGDNSFSPLASVQGRANLMGKENFMTSLSGHLLVAMPQMQESEVMKFSFPMR